MNSAVYAVGFLIVIVGVLYMAHLMHIPQTWTIGIGIVLVGLGVVSAVTNTKRKE